MVAGAWSRSVCGVLTSTRPAGVIVLAMSMSIFIGRRYSLIGELKVLKQASTCFTTVSRLWTWQSDNIQRRYMLLDYCSLDDSWG